MLQSNRHTVDLPGCTFTACHLLVLDPLSSPQQTCNVATYLSEFQDNNNPNDRITHAQTPNKS